MLCPLSVAVVRLVVSISALLAARAGAPFPYSTGSGALDLSGFGWVPDCALESHLDVEPGRVDVVSGDVGGDALMYGERGVDGQPPLLDLLPGSTRQFEQVLGVFDVAHVTEF